ncbi:hypothetical protein WME97_48725 [Sorangium sp. So ce367]|uniref:hypothetical protein n=1 Tax=Sorangium sp. So ce367 TaxID=3133305 RepID=UPI003F5F3754
MKRQAWTTGAIAAVVCGAGCGLISGVDFGDVKPRDAAEGGDAPVPCDPDAQAVDGIFVSAAAGSDESGDGTQGAPLKTVQAGIDAAIAEGKGTVYLDEGTYDEAITLPDSATGLSIEGGWVLKQGSWAADCADGVVGRTVIAAPRTVATVVQVLDVKHSSALVRLTLTTKEKGESKPDRPGESLTGVFVKDSLFKLTAVDVKVGDGGDGGLASAGAKGADASSGCDGSSAGNGANGSSPAAGAAAQATGTFTASGYTPADGKPGSDGGSGQNGTPPGSPEAMSGCNSCGDCESLCPTIPGTASGGWGRSGCGGGGGKGGASGRGGGAAVALMAVGASTEVRVDGGVLHAKNGGNGSAGGAGAPGGAGTHGVAGSDSVCSIEGECSFDECTEEGFGCSIEIFPFDPVLKGGSAGGPGGSGGRGSDGGAGAGGPSYAVVKVSGASVVISSTTKRVFGQAGKGGGTASNKAVDGTVGEELEVP